MAVSDCFKVKASVVMYVASKILKSLSKNFDFFFVFASTVNRINTLSPVDGSPPGSAVHGIL